ncbi:MAG: hypothetical protein ABSF91_13715 [Bacteroidota bacterium]|jgi:hypothetical protein
MIGQTISHYKILEKLITALAQLLLPVVGGGGILGPRLNICEKAMLRHCRI